MNKKAEWHSHVSSALGQPFRAPKCPTQGSLGASLMVTSRERLALG